MIEDVPQDIQTTDDQERREMIAYAPEIVLHTVRKYGRLTMSKLVDELERNIPVPTIFGATLMQLKRGKLHDTDSAYSGRCLEAEELPDDSNVIYLSGGQLQGPRSS